MHVCCRLTISWFLLAVEHFLYSEYVSMFGGGLCRRVHWSLRGELIGKVPNVQLIADVGFEGGGETSCKHV